MPFIFFTIITIISGFVGLVQESTSSSLFYPIRMEMREFVGRAQGTGRVEQINEPLVNSAYPSTGETLSGQSDISTVPDTGVYTNKVSPTFRVTGVDDDDDDRDDDDD